MPWGLEFATVDVNRTTFEVPAQLKLVRVVGRDTAIFLEAGAFRRIEVRRVPNPLDHVLEARRLLRQLRLRRLAHPNVLNVGVLPPPAPDLRCMYLYAEFMDTDLHRVIHSPQPLTLEHCQYFLYQLLRGLEYLHSFGLVHRDLKPSHLLVNQDCHLRVTGLASAKLQVEQDADVSETFVGVRWYRAPESFLGRTEDDGLLPMVDVWAAGCILAELVMRRVLFPGRDYIDQIRQILRVVPLPAGVPAALGIRVSKIRGN
jgi:mitogen-activated protein kinase 1/3